jgi:CBS domain-containing protein
MTSPAIAVRPEAPLRDVAALLSERGVSGAPVVDAEGRVLGVLSQTDVVARVRSRRGGALVAGDVMTQPAVTVRPNAPAAEAAASLVDLGRLPDVDVRGRLVGVVSRSDLVRAFARPDAELEEEIEHDALRGAFLWCSPGYVDAVVEDGNVVLTGSVESEDVAQLIVRSVEQVPGVLSVTSELRVDAAHVLA